MSHLWSPGKPIAVTTDGEYPLSFKWIGRMHVVFDISDRGGIDIEWWSEGVRREYFVVVTDTGWVLKLYFDANTACWWISHVYA